MSAALSFNNKEESCAYEALANILDEYYEIDRETFRSIPLADTLLMEKYGFLPRDLIFILQKMEGALQVRIPNDVFERDEFFTLQDMLAAFAKELARASV